MRIYLDHNATTPLDPVVAEEMAPFWRTNFGNPSSTHREGRVASDAIAVARGRLADSFGTKPGSVVFTSGATESINLAIMSAVARSSHTTPHIVVSAVEHPAVLEPCRWLESIGRVALSVVGVDERGRLSTAAIAEAVRHETALVAVMRANNETGNLYDTGAISAAVNSVNPNTLVLVDAVQAAGKIPLDFHHCGGDLVAISAHKMYGPKGVGALIFNRDRVELKPSYYGGGQERGLRPGTENVAGIVGFGAACTLDLKTEALREHSRLMYTGITSKLADVIEVGNSTSRLPGTLCLRFPDIDAEELLIELDLNGVSASSGSACATGHKNPSHVLLAMNLSAEQAAQTIRLSSGRHITLEQAAMAAQIIVRAVKKLRG